MRKPTYPKMPTYTAAERNILLLEYKDGAFYKTKTWIIPGSYKEFGNIDTSKIPTDPNEFIELIKRLDTHIQGMSLGLHTEHYGCSDDYDSECEVSTHIAISGEVEVEHDQDMIDLYESASTKAKAYEAKLKEYEKKRRLYLKEQRDKAKMTAEAKEYEKFLALKKKFENE